MKSMGQETFLIHLILSIKQRIRKNVALISSVFISITYSLNRYYISTMADLNVGERREGDIKENTFY